jgi:hypothetical protein
MAAMNNPWISIWLEPRKTIQSIVDRDPEYMVLPLAALNGISEALDKASTRNLGDQMSMPMLLGVCLGGGIFSGLVGLYIFGWLIRITGGWLGGSGKAQNLRTALAWAAVPSVVGLALWIPEYWLFGHDLFSANTPSIEQHPFILLAFAALQIVLAIWGLVLMCKGIGQVHGFSAWRGLSAMLIAVLLIVAPILALALGIHYLAS